MAYKIKIKAEKNPKAHSTKDIFTFIIGLFLLFLVGPFIYRVGLIMIFVSGEYNYYPIAFGLLLSFTGVFLLLITKLTEYNKFIASLLCFYIAGIQYYTEGFIEKLKLAAYNITEAQIEAGLATSDLTKRALQMDLINEVAIIIFTFLGVFCLILHIFRKKTEGTGLPPPEAPPDATQGGIN